MFEGVEGGTNKHSKAEIFHKSADNNLGVRIYHIHFVGHLISLKTIGAQYFYSVSLDVQLPNMCIKGVSLWGSATMSDTKLSIH